MPHCFGWLALDARGQWFMRDDRVQAAGPFPQVKGSRVEHAKLLDFIERNYACDAHGAWFFQNGPQRVYVELEAAPWVWRVAAGAPWALHAHSGPAAEARSTWLDAQGRLFIDTDIGFGIVHTLDMGPASDAVAAGHWRPETLAFSAMPGRFGYVLKPLPPGEDAAGAKLPTAGD